MGRSAEKTLRLLRELADRRESCTDAKNHSRVGCHASPRPKISADQYIDIVEESLAVNEKLAVYEKVAEDETGARELRILFARKANSLRITARLQATGKIASRLKSEEIGNSKHSHLVNAMEAEALLFSPVRMAGNVRERANQECQKLVKKA
jgi:hypothetical protein